MSWIWWLFCVAQIKFTMPHNGHFGTIILLCIDDDQRSTSLLKTMAPKLQIKYIDTNGRRKTERQSKIRHILCVDVLHFSRSLFVLCALFIKLDGMKWMYRLMCVKMKMTGSTIDAQMRTNTNYYYFIKTMPTKAMAKVKKKWRKWPNVAKRKQIIDAEEKNETAIQRKPGRPFREMRVSTIVRLSRMSFEQ